MNSVFTFVTAIVAIGVFGEIVKMWLKQRDKKAPENDELRETLAKVDQLEERIRVLERIVTEDRVDLKQEIDRL